MKPPASCRLMARFVTLVDRENSKMMDTSAPESLSLAVHSEDDDDDGCMSGQSSTYGDSTDFMTAAMGDEVTAQLAAAGWQKQHSHGDFLCFFYLFFLFNLNGVPR